VLQRLAKISEARYSAGEAMQQDLIKSQVEVSILATRIIEMERRKEGLSAEINALLNRPQDSPLARPQAIEPVPDLPAIEVLNQEAAESSPVLYSERTGIDARQLGLELARRAYYPDFEIIGGYFNMGSMKDMWQFGVHMNIPVFSGQKRRLGVEESIARLNEAQKNYRAQQQELSFKIKDQYLAAQTARKLMDLYAKLILPQATLALESSLNTYESGKIDFLSVLSNYSTILNNEISFYESRARYMSTLAALQELAGKQ
jgi:outer membrane protein TolC